MGLSDLLKSEAAQDLLDKGLDFVKENVTEEAIEELINKCKECSYINSRISWSVCQILFRWIVS